jgi:hypothetical protein
MLFKTVKSSENLQINAINKKTALRAYIKLLELDGRIIDIRFLIMYMMRICGIGRISNSCSMKTPTLSCDCNYTENKVKKCSSSGSDMRQHRQSEINKGLSQRNREFSLTTACIRFNRF